MDSTAYAAALAQEKETYTGLTVELLADEPTGVGFYGEVGMLADVTAITRPDESDGISAGYFMYRLNFGAHREHNTQHERAIWYKGNDLVTATQAGQVQDTVEIGLTPQEARAFFQVHPLSSAYQAWKDQDGPETYVRWLEKRVEHVLLAHPEIFEGLDSLEAHAAG